MKKNLHAVCCVLCKILSCIRMENMMKYKRGDMEAHSDNAKYSEKLVVMVAMCMGKER